MMSCYTDIQTDRLTDRRPHTQTDKMREKCVIHLRYKVSGE